MNKKNFMAIRFRITVLSVFSIFCSFSGDLLAVEKTENELTKVVLVGASIGKGWDFSNLPSRTGLTGYKLEYIGVFDTFDKSPAIDNILTRATDMPNAVIIKECSVYFPGDIENYKKQIISWVTQLKLKGIEPILATSVPPGEPTGIVHKIKSLVKSLIGKPKKIDQLMVYNQWIRDYAQKEDVKVLDLEELLRVSDNASRYLNPKFDRGDFTHLKPEAYKLLDEAIQPILVSLKQKR